MDRLKIYKNKQEKNAFTSRATIISTTEGERYPSMHWKATPDTITMTSVDTPMTEKSLAYFKQELYDEVGVEGYNKIVSLINSRAKKIRLRGN